MSDERPLPAPIDVPLHTLADHACPYLPPRTATYRAMWSRLLPGDLYHRFMNAGFRRAGHVVYQPVCRGCQLCRPIRVSAKRFAPDKSQRRCWRKNQDLAVSLDESPSASIEKFELYRRYVAARFKKAQDESLKDFVGFLYSSPVRSIEISYRDGSGKLLAVGICDVCRHSLSSVYCYYEPGESKRGLGVFSALWELEYCRQREIPWYYLGFWVKGCGTMEYKTTYRPNEIMHPDGVWRAGPSSA